MDISKFSTAELKNFIVQADAIVTARNVNNIHLQLGAFVSFVPVDNEEALGPDPGTVAVHNEYPALETPGPRGRDTPNIDDIIEKANSGLSHTPNYMEITSSISVPTSDGLSSGNGAWNTVSLSLNPYHSRKGSPGDLLNGTQLLQPLPGLSNPADQYSILPYNDRDGSHSGFESWSSAPYHGHALSPVASQSFFRENTLLSSNHNQIIPPVLNDGASYGWPGMAQYDHSHMSTSWQEPYLRQTFLSSESTLKWHPHPPSTAQLSVEPAHFNASQCLTLLSPSMMIRPSSISSEFQTNLAKEYPQGMNASSGQFTPASSYAEDFIKKDDSLVVVDLQKENWSHDLLILPSSVSAEAQTQQITKTRRLCSNASPVQLAPVFGHVGESVDEGTGLTMMGYQNRERGHDTFSGIMSHMCGSLVQNPTLKMVGPAPMSNRVSEVNKGPNKNPKRRRFTDLVLKKQTGEMRKLKACIHCQVQKIRCIAGPIPDGPCVICAKIKRPILSNLVCLRVRIHDAPLFDKGPHPQYRWSTRWSSMKVSEVDTWDLIDPEIKTIKISQGVGGVFYHLQVKKFIPQQGDSLQRTWTSDNQEMSYDCTSYAIVNMAQTGKLLMDFVEHHIPSSVRHYVNKQDTLLNITYTMALEYSQTAKNEKERKLLLKLLKLWVAIRMESRSDFIIGSETLNMLPQLWDPRHKTYKHVLVPPVMSAQIELLMTTEVLNPLRNEVLQELNELMRKSRKESWFTIYLCVFVLMHNCALLTAFDENQAKKLSLKNQYSYHKGAGIVLEFFHRCNGNSHPFTIDWSLIESRPQGVFDENQVAFMKKTSELVESYRERFNEVKTNRRYTDPYYFLAQIYDRDWRPWSTLANTF